MDNFSDKVKSKSIDSSASVKKKSPSGMTKMKKTHEKPGRYHEFVMGDKEAKNAESNSDFSSDEPKANGIEAWYKCINLDDMIDIPKPRVVDILLLKDMNEAAVLDTFESYRLDFDRLFKEREHKFQTTSYKGITHCVVVDILSKNIRNSMIEKLYDFYRKAGPHATLVFNGLLPLWIIRLFMDRYKFTHDEAVRQILDQFDYHIYIEAVKNEPLNWDLED